MLEIVDQDGLRTLRLQRPPANALDGEMIKALGRAVEKGPEEGARGLILAGKPGMFSAGLDVPALLRLDRDGIAGVWRDFFSLMRSLASSPVPIAAAVTGHSPAGGAVLALFCDYRVMAQGKFRIGLNEVRVGIPLPSSIYKAFELAVGSRQAGLLAIGGHLVGVEEAHRIGLVDEVCPPAQVEGRAEEWLRDHLALPATAFAATRNIARQGLVDALDERMEHDIEEAAERWFSKETQAALRALVASLSKK